MAREEFRENGIVWFLNDVVLPLGVLGAFHGNFCKDLKTYATAQRMHD